MKLYTREEQAKNTFYWIVLPCWILMAALMVGAEWYCTLGLYLTGTLLGVLAAQCWPSKPEVNDPLGRHTQAVRLGGMALPELLLVITIAVGSWIILPLVFHLAKWMTGLAILVGVVATALISQRRSS